MTRSQTKKYRKEYQERYRNKPIPGDVPYWKMNTWDSVREFVNKVTSRAMPRNPQRP